MNARRGLPHLCLLLAGLLLAPSARAEDPPTLDIVAALHLAPERSVAGLASASDLTCTVLAESPLTVFSVGDRVVLMSLGEGTFRVVPDATGLTACVVGETVHVIDFLSPRVALEALGLDSAVARRLVKVGIDSAEAYERQFGAFDSDTLGSQLDEVERFYDLGLALRNIGASADRIAGLVGSLRTYARSEQELQTDIDAILENRPVNPNFYDGFKAQQVIDAALASHESGCAVSIDNTG